MPLIPIKPPNFKKMLHFVKIYVIILLNDKIFKGQELGYG